jgi:hypothetical protein
LRRGSRLGYFRLRDSLHVNRVLVDVWHGLQRPSLDGLYLWSARLIDRPATVPALILVHVRVLFD